MTLQSSDGFLKKIVEQLKEILSLLSKMEICIWEGVTELAHALQAAYLAHEAGENESMTLLPCSMIMDT